MTSPNPAGQHRRLMRNAVADWLTAQQIPGVAHVFASHHPDYDFDEWPISGDQVAIALVRVMLPNATERRAAHTGPLDAGGKDIHYDLELHVDHRGVGADLWPEIEDDYDRIIDALKDSLRGQGRDLGRPLVVFQVGEWPAESSIVDRHDDPVEGDGYVDRHGVISCTISQYLQPST